MSGLLELINAAVAEDERVAQEADNRESDWWWGPDAESAAERHVARNNPKRGLRRADAYRRAQHAPEVRVSIQLHERTRAVHAAGRKLGGLLDSLQDEHGLTDVEMLGMLLTQALEIKMDMLRRERHPEDPAKKADEA